MSVKIEFIELNRDNWGECAFLWTEEDVHIASNLYSIAEAQFYPKAISRGILVDGVLVGYIMYGEDEESSEVLFVDRLMIGKEFRRRGYARLAIEKVIQYAKENGYKRLELSTEGENRTMKSFLEMIGFVTKGQIKDDEVLYFYTGELDP